MAVGNPPTVGGINSAMQNCAVTMRNLMQQIKVLEQKVSGLGATGLQNLGGPGAGYSAADAATVLQLIGFMNNVAGVYYGTVQQGGTGGTGAVFSNFDVSLTPLWGDQ